MKNKKLHHIKSSGFKTPSHYFESFEKTLMDRLDDSFSLSDLQNSGFKTPENYFETFDDRLVKAMSSEKGIKVIPLYSWKKMAYASAIAASVLLMVGLFGTHNTKPTFGNLETASLEDYIADGEYSNEDIASLVTDDLTLDNFMDSHLIDSNLEEYILNNATVEDYLKE